MLYGNVGVRAKGKRKLCTEYILNASAPVTNVQSSKACGCPFGGSIVEKNGSWSIRINKPNNENHLAFLRPSDSAIHRHRARTVQLEITQQVLHNHYYYSYSVSPKACGTPAVPIAQKTVERRKLCATILSRLDGACELWSSLSS
jgi:hypothetical protein